MDVMFWRTVKKEVDEQTSIAVIISELPEEGEEFLATNGYDIWMDRLIYENDECCLESGADIMEDLDAWMTLPDPQAIVDKEGDIMTKEETQYIDALKEGIVDRLIEIKESAKGIHFPAPIRMVVDPRKGENYVSIEATTEDGSVLFAEYQESE